MRIRKHGNPATTGAGVVARMWDKFYYLSRNKAGYYWAGPFATPLIAFRLARLEMFETLDAKR